MRRALERLIRAVAFLSMSRGSRRFSSAILTFTLWLGQSENYRNCSPKNYGSVESDLQIPQHDGWRQKVLLPE